MRGLTGFFRPGGFPAAEGSAVAEAMARRIAHRGPPDDAGVWIGAPAGIALAHRRLSIVDLSDTSARPRSTPAAPKGRPDQPNTRPANTPSPLATLPRRSPWTGRACGNAAASRRVSGASPVEPPVK